MPPKKNTAVAATGTPTDGAAPDTTPKRVIIRARTPMAWSALLKTAADQAWRKLRITIQIREKLLAGKPANLSAANAMLKARGLDEFVAEAQDIVNPGEKAEAAAKIAKDEGLCEFHRREGHPGIWMPSNNVKAGLKENWSVLGLRVKVRGSRGALAEGLFVAGDEESDWIRVGDAPDSVYEAVAHTMSMQGPVSSVKRHEVALRPILTFQVWIANAAAVADKISDDELAQCLTHFGEHGVGACRSQGFGRFDIVKIEEIAGPATAD
jgi:hypothetical protein